MTRSLRPLAAAVVTAAALAVALAPAPSARACGGFFPSISDANLAIDAQRAVMVWTGLEVRMHLQLAADTDGSDFAWILPVPETPQLSLGDAAVFDAVDALTTPTVEIIQESGGGGGGFCGADTAALDGGQGIGGGSNVTHFGGGQVGDYLWDVIGGTDAAAIASWLDDNGYVTPEGLEDLVAPYVSMRFLAVKLAPGAVTGDVLDIQPLVLTMTRPGDRKLTFPLGFGKLSATDITPVLLYVLADKRYRVSNAASTDVTYIAEEMRRLSDIGTPEVTYDAAVDSLTGDAGGRLVVTEYARDLETLDFVAPALAELMEDDAFYLTRMYARIPRASLEDLVITFAHEAEDVDNDVIIMADAGDDLPVSFALALTGLLFGVSVLRRRAA